MHRLFSSCGEWGLFFVVVLGLLIAVASFIVEHGFYGAWPSAAMTRRLQSTGSIVVACRIFPNQRRNLWPLHWQVDSHPLGHQGSPTATFNLWDFIFLSLFHETKRRYTYVCSQYMACLLYWEMSPLIIRLAILNCVSWKHMDNNVIHNFLKSPHSLRTNGVPFRGNCIVSVKKRKFRLSGVK